jgi:hypothetical protein
VCISLWVICFGCDVVVVLGLGMRFLLFFIVCFQLVVSFLVENVIFFEKALAHLGHSP